MAESQEVVVYHHRLRDFEGTPLVQGVGMVTKAELQAWLLKNPKLQMTKKQIDGRHVNIVQKDLFTEAQKESYKDKPNTEQDSGHVDIPRRIYYLKSPKELIIVSSKRE